LGTADVQVKICGITRSDDAVAAVEAGADAIGLIFYAGSKRFVTPEIAADIISNVSPYTSIVGLFVNADAGYVQTVLNHCPLSQLQFHGAESPEFCSSFDRPYVKSVPVSNAVKMSELVAAHRNARAYLFDTQVPGEHGGTGKTFDWRLMPEKNIGHRVLAGGLDAENVEQAIRIAGPDAVDVSSGVEVSPGKKDYDKLYRFIRAAKRADEVIVK
jgi:phosphoribosylanthranilate isomerase